MPKQPHKYGAMLDREKKTVGYMIGIYCRGHHKSGSELCTDCMQIKTQVFAHLEKCPFQEKKTACGRCGLKCYPTSSRGNVWMVMSYAGPRMLFYHPSLALHHLWHARIAPSKLETKNKP